MRPANAPDDHSLAPAPLAPSPPAATEPDPHAWLEEVHGDAALAWVRARNQETATWARGADFERLERELRAVLDADGRIPYVSQRGAHVVNFWKDAARPHGLWRRTSPASYRTPAPDWQVLLDMLTQYPDRVRAIVYRMPLLDMRRYVHLLAGASWIGEYGDPEQPEDWAFLRTFSPYHGLRDGQSYPPTLLTTSTRDDRVQPAHARKMMAKLRSMGCKVHYYENTKGAAMGAPPATPRRLHGSPGLRIFVHPPEPRPPRRADEAMTHPHGLIWGADQVF